ncbi:hypothetical protein JCM19237_6066 [Photobacterium aphoticum]|uniref:Uncharacterized protein n=1 Tax=Photobacterium aphoticum TaxID=754436 RepID=A0A090QLQ2_9GAMM|nr:hypothetical protein JCM19237_6066 [Photobacterium aphoticum]
MTTPSGEFHRYVIAAYADGKVDAWQLNGDINNPDDLIPTQDIQGYWRTTTPATTSNCACRYPCLAVSWALPFMM